jgi:hypothetical protein
MKEQPINKYNLRDTVSPEYSLIKISDTMGGSLTHLDSLFAKIRRQPHINCIIASAEAELGEEDLISFEHLEKTVTWFHEKIRILLSHVNWEPDSFQMTEVSALLNFHALSLNASGYVGSLLFQLRHLYLEVTKEKKHPPLFEGWIRTETRYGWPVFDWPDHVDKSLNSFDPKQQVYQWKERADTSLPCLLRFLKILSLYPTFVPLTLPAHPTLNTLPRNLLELEQKQYQAFVGYYLSLFRLPDSSKHPLSKDDLVRLIDRFLYMLEQKLELAISSDSAAPTQVNIVINQNFFFTQNIEVNATQNIEVNAMMESSPQESASDAPTASSQKGSHPRSVKCDEDVKKLIPYAKKVWIKEIRTKKHPSKLGRKELAEKLLEELPMHVSLNSKDADRLPRAKKAIALTDPRLYDTSGGSYKGLQPHWDDFGWVEI